MTAIKNKMTKIKLIDNFLLRIYVVVSGFHRKIRGHRLPMTTNAANYLKREAIISRNIGAIKLINLSNFNVY